MGQTVTTTALCIPNSSSPISVELESLELIRTSLWDGIKLKITIKLKFLPSLYLFNTEVKMNTKKLTVHTWTWNTFGGHYPQGPSRGTSTPATLTNSLESSTFVYVAQFTLTWLTNMYCKLNWPLMSKEPFDLYANINPQNVDSK